MRTYKTGRDFQPPQCLFQISILYKSSLKWKTPSLNHLGLPLSQALHLELFQTAVPLVLRNLLPISRWHLFMNNLHLLIFLLILSGFYPSLLSHRWLTGLLLPSICHRVFQSPQRDKPEDITSNLYSGIYPPLSSQVFHLDVSRTDSVLPAALFLKRLLSHGWQTHGEYSPPPLLINKHTANAKMVTFCS